MSKQVVKFNKHNVVNTRTKAKCRVYYSYSRATERYPEHVTVRAKDYGEELSPVFHGTDLAVKNETDSMTDYFVKDRVDIKADHPLFADALERAIEWEKKYGYRH